MDRLCRQLNIRVGDAELNSTSGAFRCYVQNANNAFIEYKKDSDVRRMLLKRKWLKPGKTERQVSMEKELLSIKASLPLRVEKKKAPKRYLFRDDSQNFITSVACDSRQGRIETPYLKLPNIHDGVMLTEEDSMFDLKSPAYSDHDDQPVKLKEDDSPKPKKKQITR